jgi:hypothetical protein
MMHGDTWEVERDLRARYVRVQSICCPCSGLRAYYGLSMRDQRTKRARRSRSTCVCAVVLSRINHNMLCSQWKLQPSLGTWAAKMMHGETLCS